MSDLSLASAALDALGVDGSRVSVLERTSHNIFARVDTPAGRFALRLAEQIRVLEDEVELVESAWLDALPRSWGAPRVRGIVDIDGRRCTLFDWIDGVALRDALGDDAPEQLGTWMARLHDQAATMDELPGQHAVHFDTVLTMPRHDLVSGYDQLCAEAVQRVRIEIDDLWRTPPHRPHLIHGDVGSHNAMRTETGVVLIDFQDLRVGFDVQDIGRTLADFDRGRPGWSDRFLAAYDAVRTLPDLSLERRSVLRCGRSLDVLNLGLHLRRPGFDEFWETHHAIVREITRTW